jgi:hypothetical protein
LSIESGYIQIILALIGAVVTAYYRPAISEYFNRRELYLKPYDEWCASAYGTIHEFAELCLVIQTETHTPYLHPKKGFNNPTYIISHSWEMHKVVEEGYNWLGKIRKDNKYCIDADFNKLFDEVDHLWHFLEQKYPDLLKKRDDRRDILQNLNGKQKQEIANIITNSIREAYAFPKYRFDLVQEFLLEKIPKDGKGKNVGGYNKCKEY